MIKNWQPWFSNINTKCSLKYTLITKVNKMYSFSAILIIFILYYPFFHFHSSTILLFHSSTLPLYYYSTIPIFHYTTIPFTLPLYYYSTIPLFHYTTIPFTLPLFHYITIPLFHYTTAGPIKQWKTTFEQFDVCVMHFFRN